MVAEAPLVSVFLPSFNKGEYVLDAMRSVFAQTRVRWELWILENSNDGVTNLIVERELFRLCYDTDPRVHYERLEGPEIEHRRANSYITCWLLNVYYPEANGEYIFYLSDDDVIDPDCFEVMAGELDANPEYGVVYAGLRLHVGAKPGETGPFPDTGIPALDIKSFPGSCDCKMDGGQVMHRKVCLDAMVFPYFDDAKGGHDANHADGVFLERLVGRYQFFPIPKYLITHRRTEISLWTRAVNNA